MVTIANDGDGSKAFRVLADGYWLTPPCDVQDIPMLSWVFTCLTIGYAESDTTTYAGTVSCTSNQLLTHFVVPFTNLFSHFTERFSGNKFYHSVTFFYLFLH